MLDYSMGYSLIYVVEKNLKIMTAKSDCFFNFVKSRMMSSTLFFSLPYGLIGFYGSLEK
jgi:hypothetical protein